jgi:hypothetical protein
LLIAQIEPPQKIDGGDYYYRTHAPGQAMAQLRGVHVVNLTTLHPLASEVIARADVLVLKNICDPDLLPINAERRRRRQVTVYELADDLKAVQPWNPVYAFYRDPENVQLLQRSISRCDALQVSVAELKKRYGHLHQRCWVFPNQISHVPAPRPCRKFDRVVIGWAGSHGHLNDVAAVAGLLGRWVLQRPNAVLHLMCSDPIWRLFDGLPTHKRVRTPTGSIRDYYRFLSTVDIGLGPLEDTRFNRSRSDVKFLEYAVSGVVPLMSALTPYETVRHGETGFLFEGADEMVKVLDHLVGAGSLMRDVSQTAREYVIRERLQKDHVWARIAQYERILQEAGCAVAGADEIEGCLDAWATHAGAVRRGRHLLLGETRFQQLLHDGLVYMQVRQDPERARLCFREARKLEPANALPYLFGAAVESNAAEVLRQAVARNPLSLRARILLGEEFGRRGESLAAIQSFQSAAEICPDFEVPYLRTAALLEKAGRHHEAVRLRRLAERLTPLS